MNEIEKTIASKELEYLSYALMGNIPDYLPIVNDINNNRRKNKHTYIPDKPYKRLTGRNDKCVCGSNIKYKKCCGR